MMNNKLAEKQIWTIKTKDEIYNPRLGVVYREIVKDYSYEIMLASTELDLISDDDMIMPPKGDPLTAEQVDLFRRWILEGASEKPTGKVVSSAVAESTPSSNEKN